MTTGTDVLRWAAAFFLGGGLLGLAALAVYIALQLEPAADTPWTGRALHRLGTGLIATGIVLVIVTLLGAGVVAGIRIFANH